jgi:hypothetical protein
MAKKTTTKKVTKKKVKQEDILGFNLSKVETINNVSEDGSIIELDLTEDGKDFNIRVKPKKKSILPGVVFIIVMIVLFMMSSCGTSYYHVGTGYPAKNTCSGSPSSHPQY